MNNAYVDKAWHIVVHYHAGQHYGDRPYIDHLAAVVNKLVTSGQHTSYEGDSWKVIVAGILHDIIEDTTYTQKQLREDFGTDIADAVMALTKPANYGSQQGARAVYIAQVRANDIAKRVKIADNLCNMEQCYVDGNISRLSYYAQFLRDLTKEG